MKWLKTKNHESDSWNPLSQLVVQPIYIKNISLLLSTCNPRNPDNHFKLAMDLAELEGISGHPTQSLHFVQKGKQVQFREVPKVTRGTSSSLWTKSGVLLPLCPTTRLRIGNAKATEWTRRAMWETSSPHTVTFTFFISQSHCPWTQHLRKTLWSINLVATMTESLLANCTMLC